MAATRRSMPLALRIFLLSAVLIALLAGAAAVVTVHQGERIAQQAVDRSLATSVAVQREFEQRRLEQLEFMIQQLAADAGFVNYVVDAQGAALDPEAGGVDRLSVEDLLGERREAYGFDLGLVLDPEAEVLARSDRSEAFAEHLREDPLVAPAYADLSPFSGYWRQGDALYQAAIMPLQQDQNLAGFVLLALAVDDELCRKIAAVSGSEIAFWLPAEGGPQLVATSLPPEAAAQLRQALSARGNDLLAANGTATPDRLPLDLGGQRWIAALAPTAAEGEGRLGAVLSLTSADESSAGYREIMNLVLLAGAAFLVLGLILSYLLSKGILRPVRKLAAAAEAAAAGDYRTEVGVAGNDELARLSRAVDDLLSSLREKNDIEGYLGHLGRMLPEQAPDAALPQALAGAVPRRQTLTLLAFDFRELDAAGRSEMPARLLARATQIADHVDAAARAAGAEHVHVDGARMIAAFAGADAAGRAVRCLLRVRGACVQHGIAAPAMAMHRDEVTHGELRIGATATPAAFGEVLGHLARLLAEAESGRVVLTRSLSEALKARYGAGATAVVKGRSGKPLLALKTEALPNDDAQSPAAAPLPPPMGAGELLAPGALFGQRYRIVSLLGRGGMGVVYKARDLELDDLVALKMLRPELLADPAQLERLKSELRLARKITHPNVLRTFDFGEAGGRAYISMEYVRGLTLRFLLNESGRVPLSAGLRIARQLAAGLDAAHQVGVLHRDIKPENLILEASGNAKLMDFGIARSTRSAEPGQTQVGTFVGTPQYCAPEQLAGEPLDERADIYACGVLMCEMFGGALPFAGANTMEIYLAQRQAPEPPSLHWPDIPPALEAVILKCLAHRREDRYARAADLLTALSEIRA